MAAALLASTPSCAFDAAGADIIGLRLGMSEAEVVDRLVRQGYSVSSTAEVISANTKDGRLQVALSAERGAVRISYIFYGRVPAKIVEAVLIRFGAPDQAQPPTWCRAVGSDGICPRGQASLTFLPESLTLILRGEADDHP